MFTSWQYARAPFISPVATRTRLRLPPGSLSPTPSPRLDSTRLDSTRLTPQHSLLACALQPDASEVASSFWNALANEFFEDDAELQIQATLDEEGVPRPRFFGAHARTHSHTLTVALTHSLLRRTSRSTRNVGDNGREMLKLLFVLFDSYTDDGSMMACRCAEDADRALLPVAVRGQVGRARVLVRAAQRARAAALARERHHARVGPRRARRPAPAARHLQGLILLLLFLLVSARTSTSWRHACCFCFTREKRTRSCRRSLDVLIEKVFSKALAVALAGCHFWQTAPELLCLVDSHSTLALRHQPPRGIHSQGRHPLRGACLLVGISSSRLASPRLALHPVLLHIAHAQCSRSVSVAESRVRRIPHAQHHQGRTAQGHHTFPQGTHTRRLEIASLEGKKQ